MSGRAPGVRPYDATMNLHVLHESRVLAQLVGGTPPACDALACRLGAPQQVAAAWIDGNPLQDGWLASVEVPGPRLMCWSGSLGPQPFEPHPANWMRPGRTALDALVTRAAAALEAQGVSLCLRPHAHQVLSDAQGCLRFLADHAGLPVQVALAPVDLVTAGMLAELPEHLSRIFTSLGPRAAVVLLEDLRPAEGDEPPGRAPLGQGVLPRDLVLELLRSHVPPETPVIVRAEGLSGQLAWLGLTG